MELIPTALPDVLRVIPTVHGDDRGFFVETFRDEWLPGLTWPQDNLSRSRYAGTLRGLHYQVPPRAQAKLVRVLQGRVIDVAVDLRAGSPTRGHHVKVELTGDRIEWLLVPAGFAHGFITMLDDTVVAYKVSDYYEASLDRGVAWDDPDLAIDWGWPAADITLSDRDRRHPRLADIPPMFGES